MLEESLRLHFSLANSPWNCLLNFFKEWRFDEQAIPSDLIIRCMALDESESPIGAHMLFQDCPYGLDGLDVWLAIQTWVGDFCDIFCEDYPSVKSDTEIRAWWSEIRNVGHGDKRNETWWCQMTTNADLKQTLTTLIWITSALHASVNFRFQVTLGIALMEVLSRHMSEEVYLGQRSTSEWIDNKEVKPRFEKFNECLREIEMRILERNGDPELRNRGGPAKVPYKLLYPGATKLGNVPGIMGQRDS